MRRTTRALVHKKGNKIRTVDRDPLSTDGTDGDIVVRPAANGGAFLFAKAQGRWFKFAPVSNTIDGWHGSRKKIKITNHDLRASSGAGGHSVGEIVYQSTSAYYLTTATDHLAYIHCHIPKGFIATAIYLQISEFGGGAASPPEFRVSQSPVTSSDLVTRPEVVLIDYRDWSDEEHAFTSLMGDDNSVLSISIRGIRGISAAVPKHLFYGGYIKIQPVLTAERQFSEGLDETSILERSSSE